MDPVVGLPPVLDACCGPRMMWFDKHDYRAIYVDVRAEDHTYLNGERKKYSIHIAPDQIADFTNLPFPSNIFALVVFDPPHLLEKSKGGHMAKKYGTLPHEWRDMLRKGLSECFRVLRPEGVLVFKWSSHHIPLGDVTALTPHKPLFGNRKPNLTKTHWLLYMKPKGA